MEPGLGSVEPASKLAESTSNVAKSGPQLIETSRSNVDWDKSKHWVRLGGAAKPDPTLVGSRLHFVVGAGPGVVEVSPDLVATARNFLE